MFVEFGIRYSCFLNFNIYLRSECINIWVCRSKYYLYICTDCIWHSVYAVYIWGIVQVCNKRSEVIFIFFKFEGLITQLPSLSSTLTLKMLTYLQMTKHSFGLREYSNQLQRILPQIKHSLKKTFFIYACCLLSSKKKW